MLSSNNQHSSPDNTQENRAEARCSLVCSQAFQSENVLILFLFFQEISFIKRARLRSKIFVLQFAHTFIDKQVKFHNTEKLV